MNRLLSIGSFLCSLCFSVGGVYAAELAEVKATALDEAAARAGRVEQWGKQIWEFAEPAFQERKSSQLLADALEADGFRVRRGVAEMPSAFVAEFGSGKPVVALLAEYDALPGLSNAASPTQQPEPRQTAGHGCGHNLFGAAIVGSAMSVKAAMQKHAVGGTLRVYGCPAEEGGCGKAYLIRAGEFRDVDLALHWHPGDDNKAGTKSSLAIVRFRVRFQGKAAHAAGSPQAGRSALDAVELMNIGVNFLREHVPSSSRIHYVITDGGRRPNVVPDTAEAWYYIRAPKMTDVLPIFERVKKIAAGAELMTETKHELRMITGSYEILPNEPLARAVHENLKNVGPPSFTPEDRTFAEAIRRELGVDGRGDEPLAAKVAPFSTETGNGSTDVGDVSWTVPTAGFGMATAARNVPGHSWAMTACAGSTLGAHGSVAATKVLAASTVDLLLDEKLREAAVADFRERLSRAKYEPVLDPGPPPSKLDDF